MSRNIGLPLGLLYFVAASAALATTRFEDGVAFIWVASAFLIADLVERPTRLWTGPILACAVASLLAIGFFGLGWLFAVPLAIANMAEAAIAAYLFKERRPVTATVGSLAWQKHFIWAVGLVGPAVGATIAAAALQAGGRDAAGGFSHFFAGHALGGLTFAPLVILLLRGKLASSLRFSGRRMPADVAMLLLAMAGTTFLVFSQSSLPLLFLPLVVAVFITFRVGYCGAAIAIGLLALIGGGLTLMESGPAQLLSASLGARLQFFQLYLAVTLLTVLPIAASLFDRTAIEQDLRIGEARFRMLVDHSSDTLLHMEPDGTIRFASASARQMLGHDPVALVGESAFILVAPEHSGEVRNAYQATLAGRGMMQRVEWRGARGDGEMRWFEAHARAIVDKDGSVDGVLSIVRDITDRKTAELRLARQAHTDALTGLPNRRAFHGSAERRHQDAELRGRDCIAIIDIDHFKRVNDTFGHGAGDLVLTNFARLAERMLRHSDTIARLGGEEFAILFRDTSVEQARQICDRLRMDAAAMETAVANATVRVTISAGIAPVPTEGLEGALLRADAELYRAKEAGRNRISVPV